MPSKKVTLKPYIAGVCVAIVLGSLLSYLYFFKVEAPPIIPPIPPTFTIETFAAGSLREPEMAFYGLLGNYLYWGSTWYGGPGHFYKTDITTKAASVVFTPASRVAAWHGVKKDNVIWVAGQCESGGALRSTIWRIDSAGCAFASVLNTGDCNEFIGFDIEGQRLVVGERGAGGGSAGSVYPNGGGLWVVPLSTWQNVATWTRVYEDPDHFEWSYIVNFNGVWYAYLTEYANSKWKVMKSTDLTTWTVELDYRSQSTRDLRGMLFPCGDKLIALGPVQATNSMHMFILKGAVWSDVNLEIANPEYLHSSIHGVWLAQPNKVVLLVAYGNGWMQDVVFYTSLYISDSDGSGVELVKAGFIGGCGGLGSRECDNLYGNSFFVPLLYCGAYESRIGIVRWS